MVITWPRADCLPNGLRPYIKGTNMITTTSKRVLKSSAAALVAVIVTLPAFAESRDEYPFMDEVKSCVEETYNRIDTDGATHARHVVTEFDTSMIGYALRIETSITTPENETTYAVYCVANGANTPIKFRIKEQSS